LKARSHSILTGLIYFSIALASPAHAQQLVPFSLLHDAFPVVKVQAAGQGPFEFVLDTGTDTTILDTALAHSLGLIPSDRVTLTTPAGRHILLRSSIPTVRVGTAELSDVEVLVQDIPTLRSLSPHIRGILGQNFLSRFNYVLDYDRNLLLFESQNELRDSASGDRVSLSPAGSMVIQSDMQSLGIANARLLLDSAVNYLVLFRTKEQLPPFLSNQTISVLNSSNDQRTGEIVRLQSLTIGGRHFQNLKLALVSPEKDSTRMEDGLLPTVLFHALYVNNREGFVVFNPKYRHEVKRE
jgi:predicted aspartyl protease